MPKANMIKIDLKQFHQKALQLNEDELADYLQAYYKVIDSSCKTMKARIVKCIGDCVLIEAEEKLNDKDILDFSHQMKAKYDVSIHVRLCQFSERHIQLDSYTCKDVIGKDINFLFMQDEHTRILNE